MKYIKKENEEMVMIRYGASAAGKVFINKYGAIANNMFKINLNIFLIFIKINYIINEYPMLHRMHLLDLHL